MFMTLAPITILAQEDGKSGPTDEALDELVKEQPIEKPAETPAAKPEEQKPVETKPAAFPVDSRRIHATIKMKNGKAFSGVVKHFLVSDRLIDHLQEPDFTLCDGPTVSYNADEYVMNWEQVSSVQFNSKNKENGEISCVEDSDASPERMECVMTNEYIAFSKDKAKPGEHVIRDKELFRFVIDTGKALVNVDGHLGKIKINNMRDESRKDKEMAKELNSQFANGILSIHFN